MKNRCFVEFADRLKSALDAKQPLVVQLHRKPAQLRTAKGAFAFKRDQKRAPVSSSEISHRREQATSSNARGGIFAREGKPLTSAIPSGP